jgi:hypothetical protein
MSLTICLNCFYNINDVEQTLNSIDQNKYEIVCMENPSKYEMSALFQNKNQNIKHYKCSENIDANIFTLFYWFYKNKKKTKYLAFSEADVIIDTGAIEEALFILSNNQAEICSIGLKMDYKKYKGLPIRSWVPCPQLDPKNNVMYGHTGFQFIIASWEIWDQFFNALENRKLNSGIALGSNEYFGISDSNLKLFADINNLKWAQTKNNLLDHIGWLHYLNEQDEYWQYKNLLLKNKKIRHQSDHWKNTTLTRISYL